ncbi:MAG: hypothetical protein Q7N50_12410 [Armatimonadota bacterium]|nr:hypothetical protein [Armatimonadota bacterium]
MIKINLLPQYVFEKQAVQRLMLLFGLALAGVVVLLMGLRMQMGGKLNNLNEQLVQAKMVENEVLTKEQQRSAELARIGPIQQKVTFIEDVMKYNEKAPALYEELARFTYARVKYKQINLTDQQMEIQAYAPSITDAGRYLLNLYRATHIFKQVSMSSVPGYQSETPSAGGYADSAVVARGASGGAMAPAKPKGFEFTVSCTLAQPITAPSYGAGGAPPAQ